MASSVALNVPVPGDIDAMQRYRSDTYGDANMTRILGYKLPRDVTDLIVRILRAKIKIANAVPALIRGHVTRKGLRRRLQEPDYVHGVSYMFSSPTTYSLHHRNALIRLPNVYSNYRRVRPRFFNMLPPNFFQ